jgi:hypothetical protein
MIWIAVCGGCTSFWASAIFAVRMASPVEGKKPLGSHLLPCEKLLAHLHQAGAPSIAANAQTAETIPGEYDPPQSAHGVLFLRSEARWPPISALA